MQAPMMQQAAGGDTFFHQSSHSNNDMDWRSTTSSSSNNTSDFTQYFHILTTLTLADCNNVKDYGKKMSIVFDSLKHNRLLLGGEPILICYFMHGLGPRYEHWKDIYSATHAWLHDGSDGGRSTFKKPVVFKDVWNSAVSFERLLNKMDVNGKMEVMPSLFWFDAAVPWCTFCGEDLHVEEQCCLKHPELRMASRKRRRTCSSFEEAEEMQGRTKRMIMA